MKLSNIIKNLKCDKIINYMDHNIECMTHLSTDVIDNSIFFCINGSKADGLDYINEAIQNGAKVIVSDRDVDIDQTVIVVNDVRKAMSLMAKNFYDKADEKLCKIAVIGTNGKTTTSHIIANILSCSGKKVGIIGTNGVYINGEFLPCSMTTPDPIELHYIFSQMVAFGVEIVVMEVSAHAIYYGKVEGIKFEVGVFTNITNEHLDFFGTMDNYANTKISLFNKQNIKESVVNIDDPYGKEIAKLGKLPVVSYGIYNPANIFAVNIKINMARSKFFVNVNDEVVEIECPLVGEYNIYNILASIGAVRLLGIELNTIVKALRKQKEVAGRFNVFKMANNRIIIVDFAHTPDGFDKVLSLVKKLRNGRIITLFGAVGYSDSDKRSLMGEIASRYSDKLIITTDNLGKSDFSTVCQDIIKNIPLEKIAKIEKNRRVAVEYGIRNMLPNDTLVLLGKGAETTQIIDGEEIEYSELEVVKELISGVDL